MSEQQQEPVVEANSANLGEQLRQARELKKYSIAEVAAQLRLTKDIISHLENQQWDKLNGRIYARGYFASYAKFLGLPHDEMLAVFNLEYSATEPSLNLNQHGNGGTEKPFPWLMLIFVVTILVVGCFGYQQWQATQLASQTDDNEQAQEMAAEDNTFESRAPLAPILGEPSVIAESTTYESDYDYDYDSADELALSQDNATELNPTEALESEDVLAQSEVELDELSEVGAEAMQTATPAEPETQASTLKMSFSGECWVEVTNSEAKVLLSKVMRAQDSVELSSELPLKLLLGRAEVVTVIFNNEQVDLSPHTQGNVARLTLGVES